jgi:oligoendopeptidase F
LLDVHTRFQFERAFYEERAKGEVRSERLSELMKETQLRIFGDTLDPNGADPYFWASKLHFFITGVSFYNYPYIFGYLLSRGLYARFAQEGQAFLSKYEQFLERSASEEPAALARRVLGCDLEQPDFWEQSIQSVLSPLLELEQRLG